MANPDMPTPQPPQVAVDVDGGRAGGHQWLTAALPHDEAERLVALRSYQVLDSVPEQEYEDLVLLASTICEAPFALLTMVDSDRQWVKAAVGTDCRETSRDVAFCAHTILGSDIMEVPDAASDGRFAGNPLVTGDPKIRFYAGAPLINGDGMALGALCVVGQSPRPLSQEQTAALRALGRQAMSLLELRRQRQVDTDSVPGLRAAQDELRRQSGLLKLLGEVALRANQAASLEEALHHAVELVRAHMQWPAGRAVVISDDRPGGPPRPSWHVNSPETPMVHPVTVDAGEGRRESLAAAVARTRGPVLDSIDQPGDVPGDPEATPSMRAAVGFPVLVGTEVVAVMEFFAEERINADNDLREAMAQIGIQLGRIAERVRATETLQAREAATRAIIDTAGDAFVAMDARGTVTDWNPRAETMFGWRREEAIGEPLTELIVPARFRNAVRADFRRFLAGGQSRILGHRLKLNALHRDGNLISVDVTVWPMRSGDELYFNAFVRDRSDPMADLKDIQEVREAHDLFSAVLGATTEYAIIGTDLQGDITFFNVGAEKMLGYQSAEVVDRRTPLFLHDSAEIAARAEELGVEPGFEALVACAHRGQPDTREWTYLRKNRMRLTVSLSVTAIEGSDGRPVGFITIAFDVTERRKADEARSRLAAIVQSSEAALVDALERQKEMVARLQELDRAKTDFVSSVSHELRTPLTGMLGYLEMLAGGDAGELGGDQLQVLDIIDVCARRLSVLIEDLLTVSQIESGAFRLDPGPVAIGPLVEAARQAVIPMLAQRQVEMTVGHPHDPDALPLRHRRRKCLKVVAALQILVGTDQQ